MTTETKDPATWTRARLLQEVYALAPDAERYRWMRDSPQEIVDVYFATDANPTGWGCWDSWEDKNAGVDAAIQRHAPSNARNQR